MQLPRIRLEDCFASLAMTLAEDFLPKADEIQNKTATKSTRLHAAG
jgi:hypothetical protein